MRKFTYFICSLFICTAMFCSCDASYIDEVIGTYRFGEKIYHTSNWSDDILEGCVIEMDDENLIFSCSDCAPDNKPVALEKFKLSKDNFDSMFSKEDFFCGTWEDGYDAEGIRKNNRASWRAVLNEYNTTVYVLLQNDGTVFYSYMIGSYSGFICVYVVVLEMDLN